MSSSPKSVRSFLTVLIVMPTYPDYGSHLKNVHTSRRTNIVNPNRYLVGHVEQRRIWLLFFLFVENTISEQNTPFCHKLFSKFSSGTFADYSFALNYLAMTVLRRGITNGCQDEDFENVRSSVSNVNPNGDRYQRFRVALRESHVCPL